MKLNIKTVNSLHSLKKDPILTMKKLNSSMRPWKKLIVSPHWLKFLMSLKHIIPPILKNQKSDWKKSIQDFKVIKRLCSKYENIEEFLSHLALDPPNDAKAVFKNTDDSNKDFVTISTIHSSKGLEWNTVFVICLIDGALPNKRSLNNPKELEEERRVFYVACSRAKENLYLTRPDYLEYYSSFFEDNSRFIEEIDPAKYQSI